MAGPNLELFKFGLYLFFPLAVMVHYGDPEWYHRHVLPIRDQFWPKEESLYKPPRNAEDVKAALEDFKAKRLARREARLAQEQEQQAQGRTSSSSSAAATVASSLQTQEQQGASSSINRTATQYSEGQQGTEKTSLAQRLKTDSAFTRGQNRSDFGSTDRARLV